MRRASLRRAELRRVVMGRALLSPESCSDASMLIRDMLHCAAMRLALPRRETLRRRFAALCCVVLLRRIVM